MSTQTIYLCQKYHLAPHHFRQYMPPENNRNSRKRLSRFQHCLLITAMIFGLVACNHVNAGQQQQQSQPTPTKAGEQQKAKSGDGCGCSSSNVKQREAQTQKSLSTVSGNALAAGSSTDQTPSLKPEPSTLNSVLFQSPQEETKQEEKQKQENTAGA